MRCLECGKRLPILRKLTDGEFCSSEHRRKFQEEQEKLALARLLESRDRIAEQAARSRPLDETDLFNIRTPFVQIRPAMRLVRLVMRCRIAAEPQSPALCYPAGVVPESSLLACCRFQARRICPVPWGFPKPWGEPAALDLSGAVFVPYLDWSLDPALLPAAAALSCGIAILSAPAPRESALPVPFRVPKSLPSGSLTASVLRQAGMLALSPANPLDGARAAAAVKALASSLAPLLPASGLKTVHPETSASNRIPRLAPTLVLFEPWIAPPACRRLTGPIAAEPERTALLPRFPARTLDLVLAVAAGAPLSVLHSTRLLRAAVEIGACPVSMPLVYPAIAALCSPYLIAAEKAETEVEVQPWYGERREADSVAFGTPASYPASHAVPIRQHLGRADARPDVPSVAMPSAHTPEPVEVSGATSYPAAVPAAARHELESADQLTAEAPQAIRPGPSSRPAAGGFTRAPSYPESRPVPARQQPASRYQAVADIPEAAGSDANPRSARSSLAAGGGDVTFPPTQKIPVSGAPLPATDQIATEPAIEAAAAPRRSADPVPITRSGRVNPLSPPAPAVVAYSVEEDPQMPGLLALSLPEPRRDRSGLAVDLEPYPACADPYAPMPPHALPAAEMRAGDASPLKLALGPSANTGGQPLFNEETCPPSSDPKLPRFGIRPIPPRPASDETPAEEPAASPVSRLAPFGHFWKHAPADLRWIALILPLAILFGLHQGARKVRLDTGSGLGGVVKARFDDVRVSILRRAAVEHQEDFKAGLSLWDGQPNWAKGWRYDANGSVRPGPLAVYHPSVGMADYRFEFLGQIESKALSWVYRAADLDNYYVTKIVLTKPGPLPSATVVRYAVIHGKEGPRKQVPLPMQVRPDMMYRVRMDISGQNFTTSVQGQVVDFFSDDRLPAGGVGFFTAKGEGSLLRWMELTHQYDILGRLCAFLAPYSMPRDGSWNQ